MSDKPLAIIDDSGSVSYSELSRTINCTASYYHKAGIKSGDFIALLGENSTEYVIAIFSLWKLGAIPVPINNKLNKAEIKKILSDSGSRKILSQKKHALSFENVDRVKMLIVNEGEEFSEKHETNADDIAVVIYTSGSSGYPKGVMTTNENLYSSYMAANSVFKFSHEDVFLASLPFYHIGGFSIINRMLLSGGTLVIPKSLKTNSIAVSIKNNVPTVLSLVPTMLKRLIEDGIIPNKKLRHLFLGGGPSDDDLIEKALNEKWPIAKVYGSSETTAMVTACMGDNLRKNPASAGKAFDGIELKIFDDFKKEIKNSEIGEIAVKGKNVSKGYLNNNELWQSKIKEGFYFTGDFGYLDKDKNLFVIARRTDLIVSGGENIIPQEIERELLLHHQIAEVKVFGVEDKEWGQKVCAAIVSKKKEKITEIELKKYLEKKIAAYKIPKMFVFVDELPKTELGKIEILKLKKLISKQF